MSRSLTLVKKPRVTKLQELVAQLELFLDGLKALDKFEATGDRRGFREWSDKYNKITKKGR